MKPNHKQRSKALRWMLAGVLVLGVGAYVVWRLVPSAADTVKQADAANASGNYASSYNKLKSAYNRAIFTSDKALILSRLAPAAEDSGDNEAALNYYQQLNRAKPRSLPTLLAMGDLADKMGRRDVEVQAYSQAIELMKSETKGPRTQDYIDTLQAKVQGLQS